MKAAQVMTEVGHRVAELRRARGWSQEQLAERLRVDARTLQRIEAGRHITFIMLVQLATAFRVPIGELFEAPMSRTRRPGRPPREPYVITPAPPSIAAEPRREYETRRRSKRRRP